jgi:periplasmic protein TonB
VKIKKTDKELTWGKGNHTVEFSNFDDLVFENRNKEYGAYLLRKRYNRTLFAGTVFASLLAVTAVLIPFLARPSSEKIVSGGNGYAVSVRMENLEPPVEKIYVPPAPPPPEATKMPETVEYLPPVVVDTIVPIGQTMVTTDEALASNDNDVIDGGGSGFGDDLLSGNDGSNSEEPLLIVEVMPAFKGGGLDNFRLWLQKRTNYPAAAIEQKLKGTVFLTFIVEKDGSVSNVTIIKGVHPLLDNEAVKAISGSPKWSPGLQRGQPVRVRFQIPLSFN